MSPGGATVTVSGTNASASSNTEPKSSSSAVPLAFAVRWLSSHTHSSSSSTRDKSIPVAESTCVIERQRGPSWWGRTQFGAPLRDDASPSTVSGFIMSHSAGSADCA